MAQQGPHSNVFVAELTPEVTQEQLQSLFAAHGGVESCRVASKDGKTNGFVKMVDVESAERAIAALNGQNGLTVKPANFDVGGKQKLYGARNQAWEAWGKGYGKGWGKGYGGYGGSWAPQRKLLPRESEPEKPEGPPSENLYVKHLPVGITEDEIKATFQQAGEVAECRILRPGMSLEWAALVRMSSPEQGAAARATVDNTFPVVAMQPFTATVQTKNGTPKEDHCYLKSVPTNTTKANVEALFGKFGEVKWCDVLPPAMRGGTDNTGAVLVEMGSPEECQKAIAALHEQTLPFGDLGSTLKVRYALIKDKAPEGAAAP